jgi:hypothetical protein
LCDKCCLLSDVQNIQKGNRVVRLSFHSEADGRALKLWRWTRKLCNCPGP